MKTPTRSIRLLALSLATPLLAAACGGGEDVAAPVADPVGVAAAALGAGDAIDALGALADPSGRVDAVVDLLSTASGTAQVPSSAALAYRGRALKGLLQGSPLAPGKVRLEGRRVDARGVPAIVGVISAVDGSRQPPAASAVLVAGGATLPPTAVTDGTSNTIMFGEAFHDSAHLAFSVAGAKPSAAGTGQLVPGDLPTGAVGGTLSAAFTVVWTAIGPVAVARGTFALPGQPQPHGIIAILIGL